MKTTTNTNPTEERFDVVIYEYETRKIDTIAGTDLKLEGRHNSVESRLSVVLPRLNERYGATEVEAGKYKKGDKLP